jgi:hypothetical protein
MGQTLTLDHLPRSRDLVDLGAARLDGVRYPQRMADLLIELARLKHLPRRPPQKPSGMNKSTDRGGSKSDSDKGDKPVRRRGSTLDKLRIDEPVVVKAKAPCLSRHKGFEEIVVQDLVLNPKVTR